MMERMGKQRVRAALIKTKGNMTKAAELIGMSRQGVWNVVNRHPDLRQLCEELMEESIDTWEGKLEDIGVKQNNPTALLGLLNAHGKHRGYARHASDVTVSGAVDHRHVHLHASMTDSRLAEIEDDKLLAMIDQRRAALALEDQRQLDRRQRRAPALIEGRAEAVPPAPETGEPDRED